MQEEDVYKATLIELNYDLIERACLVIRSAVANSMDWSDIELLVKDANKWLKWRVSASSLCHLLGIFRKQDASILSNIDAAL